MQKLRWHDLQWCLRRAPVPVLKLMKEYGPQLIAAGGFVRSCVANEPINDIDLFTSSKELARSIAEKLADGKPYHTTDNAYTLRNGYKVTPQLVHRWVFDSPVKLVDSFDFTVAKAGFWWQTDPVYDELTWKDVIANTVKPTWVKGSWRSVCHDDFYADLAAKRLVYVSPEREEDAGGSLLRVLKFYQRGYRIPLDSLGAVLARLTRAMDWDKINSHGDPEKQAAKIFTGLLREVDPNVDPTHVAHLPSQSEETDELPV